MPFLGNQPVEGYKTTAKQTITGDGSSSYALDNKVTSASDLEVFINNVRQEPGVDYTASGNTITFTTAVASSDSCWLVYQGKAVTSNLIESQNIADGSVTAGKLDTTYAKITNSASAPSNPSNGDMWFNTSASPVSGIVEKAMAVWNGTEWQQMSNTPEKFTIATGGTITTDGDYKIHTFTSSGTFSITQIGDNYNTFEYLVIAGGGGGGCDSFGTGDRAGGGGGAGGYRCAFGVESSGGGSSTETPLSLSVGGHTVTVGAGGAGASNASQHLTGASGTNSTLYTITSTGGGGGGSHLANPPYNQNGVAGGSGGGSANSSTGGSGTAGQGYAGGNGAAGAPYAGSGGGGAGSVGTSTTVGAPGHGGSGLNSLITGSSVGRAGGGGGCGTSTSGSGTHGGGAGGTSIGVVGTAGTVNTGGGGGASREADGAQGGSGVVIIRYRYQQELVWHIMQKQKIIQ